ncbi:MAG: teichoic acid D-Ala incorporation-associated protein DltX [Anaerolineae bacterium]
MIFSSLLATVRRLAAIPWVRLTVLIVYYLLILIVLVIMYGRGDFNAPPFIYQGF